MYQSGRWRGPSLDSTHAPTAPEQSDATLLGRVKMLEATVRNLHQQITSVGNKYSLADCYRGVYEQADRDFFTRGQLVTHSGSLWLCMKDKPGGAPGQCPDWQLIVKKGRDARDRR